MIMINRIIEAQTRLNMLMLPNTNKQHYNKSFYILCKKFPFQNMLRNKLLAIKKVENGLKNRIWVISHLKV